MPFLEGREGGLHFEVTKVTKVKFSLQMLTPKIYSYRLKLGTDNRARLDADFYGVAIRNFEVTECKEV